MYLTLDDVQVLLHATHTLGCNVEDTIRVLTILENIMGTPHVTTEDLRAGLGEAFPGACPLTARALGIPLAVLYEQLEAGTLRPTEFLPRFLAQAAKELA